MRGSVELQEEHSRRVRLFESIKNALVRYEAAVVRDLPIDVQEEIGERLLELRSEAWLDAEQKRLERLEDELLPHVAHLVVGPV